MAADGADIIDIGGESTRPGADPLPARRRSCGACCRSSSGWRRGSRSRSPSTPTRRGSPGRRSTAAPRSSTTSAACSTTRSWARSPPSSGAALILMHTRGRSAGMYDLAVYDGSRAGRRAGAGRGRRPGGARGRVARRDHRRSRPRVRQAGGAQLRGAGAARHAGRARSTDPVGPFPQVVPESRLGEREPSAREWGTAAAVDAPACCSARTSSAFTASPHMVDVVRVSDRLRASAQANSSAW